MKESVLVIIPAYNEEASIADVLMKLRQLAPEYDRVVVNDGSQDETDSVVDTLGEKQFKLLCNLGYGRALQTGMKYALGQNYDIVVCLDADGQHRPDDVTGVVQALLDNGSDMVIGSRYCDGRPYTGPLNRRLGQQLFSYMTGYIIGHRIYDTTSGFKAIRADACKTILSRTFMDFHIEAIVRLCMNGFKISEHPIVVQERSSGSSMHSYVSNIAYPITTLLLTAVAAIDVLISRRTR